MAHISRKELKKDAVRDTFAHGADAVLAHQQQTIYLVIAGLIGYALQIVGIDWTVVTLVFGLIQLLIGLEGTNLVRWSRVRHGWYDHGAVIADDRELAERRFFDSRRAVRPADVSVAASAPTLPPASEVGQSRSDVVGLFPEPGGGL